MQSVAESRSWACGQEGSECIVRKNVEFIVEEGRSDDVVHLRSPGMFCGDLPLVTSGRVSCDYTASPAGPQAVTRMGPRCSLPSVSIDCEAFDIMPENGRCRSGLMGPRCSLQTVSIDCKAFGMPESGRCRLRRLSGESVDDCKGIDIEPESPIFGRVAKGLALDEVWIRASGHPSLSTVDFFEQAAASNETKLLEQEAQALASIEAKLFKDHAKSKEELMKQHSLAMAANEEKVQKATTEHAEAIAKLKEELRQQQVSSSQEVAKAASEQAKPGTAQQDVVERKNLSQGRQSVISADQARHKLADSMTVTFRDAVKALDLVETTLTELVSKREKKRKAVEYPMF